MASPGSPPSLMTVPTQPDPHPALSNIQRIRAKDWSQEHRTFNLLEEENWQLWREDIELTFTVCGLHNYVDSTIQCPNKDTDPIRASNWSYNNDYTKKAICDHISHTQKYHITNCKTAQEMWSNLQAIHQACGNQTKNQLMHKLTDTKASEGDDIIKHLYRIKKLWDCITLVCQGDLLLSPKLFKKLLAYSIPPLWDDFTRQFTCDPLKKDITVPQSHSL